MDVKNRQSKMYDIKILHLQIIQHSEVEIS